MGFGFSSNLLIWGGGCLSGEVFEGLRSGPPLLFDANSNHLLISAILYYHLLLYCI